MMNLNPEMMNLTPSAAAWLTRNPYSVWSGNVQWWEGTAEECLNWTEWATGEYGETFEIRPITKEDALFRFNLHL